MNPAPKTSAPRTPAPWTFWAVAVLSLLWNAFGAFDYTMTNLRDLAYLAQFPPEMMPILDAFPLWAMVAWALGVWGALLGSVLLLVRSRLAVAAFGVSLAGLAVSTAYQVSIDMPPALKTTGMLMVNLVIWAAAIFLVWFAVRQSRAGRLR